MNNGDLALAVEALHTRLLAPVERWREHIAFGVDASAYATHGNTGAILRRGVLSQAQEGESSYAAVVTAEGRLRTWVRLSTSQQLREVLLVLLIWGESANLCAGLEFEFIA